MCTRTHTHTQIIIYLYVAICLHIILVQPNNCHIYIYTWVLLLLLHIIYYIYTVCVSIWAHFEYVPCHSFFHLPIPLEGPCTVPMPPKIRSQVFLGHISQVIAVTLRHRTWPFFCSGFTQLENGGSFHSLLYVYQRVSYH